MNDLEIIHGENDTGTGMGVWVAVNGVTVWGHVFHLDGPVSDDTKALLNTLGPYFPARPSLTEEPTQP